MPSNVTHRLFAKRVLVSLPSEITAEINKDAYFWGAQGPDFLFTHRFFPWMRGRSLSHFGEDIHRARPCLVLSAMRNYLDRHDEPIYRSYIMGFVTHYALDSSAHPYVNMLAAELIEDRPYENMTTLHAEIESALDTIVLRADTGKLPTEIKIKTGFPKNEAVQRAIAKIYKHLILDLFGQNIDERELFAATKDARRVFGALTDRTTLKKWVFAKIEKNRAHTISSHIMPLLEDADIDYANTGKSPWNVSGHMSEQSFFEIMDEASGRAQEIIKSFDECDLAKVTQDIPFG